MNGLFSLAGCRALVTGGAVHIGRGIVKALVRSGARVGVAYCSHGGDAAELAAKMRAEGGVAETIPLDVRDAASVRNGFEAMDRVFGGIDLLVNNAGIFSLASQAELSEQGWDEVFAVTLRGVFLCCREAARRLPEGGAIVNIASINALHPGFGQTAHYDAAKGGVAAYTRSLAAELAPQGVRVNAVAPGLTDSAELRQYAGDLARKVETRTPLQKLATPENIGAAVLFLASAAASHITGQMLVVDGGYLLT